jgi:hypothetical protein
MTAFCTHLAAIYYTNCSPSDVSRRIECDAGEGECSSVCSQCKKFAARQFWQSPPKTISEAKNIVTEPDPPQGYTGTGREAWQPSYTARKTFGNYAPPIPASGCGGCGGRKNYTK